MSIPPCVSEFAARRALADANRELRRCAMRSARETLCRAARAACVNAARRANRRLVRLFRGYPIALAVE